VDGDARGLAAVGEERPEALPLTRWGLKPQTRASLAVR
jgi:hypothetical protein